MFTAELDAGFARMPSGICTNFFGPLGRKDNSNQPAAIGMAIGGGYLSGPTYFKLDSSFAFACWNSSSVSAP
jgi:hypothetical protein